MNRKRSDRFWFLRACCFDDDIHSAQLDTNASPTKFCAEKSSFLRLLKIRSLQGCNDFVKINLSAAHAAT